MPLHHSSEYKKDSNGIMKAAFDVTLNKLCFQSNFFHLYVIIFILLSFLDKKIKFIKYASEKQFYFEYYMKNYSYRNMYKVHHFRP